MFAVVMVNECAGLTPSDFMYWMLSCWAMPKVAVIAPLMAGGLAMGAAYLVTRQSVRYRLFRSCGQSVIDAIKHTLRIG